MSAVMLRVSAAVVRSIKTAVGLGNKKKSAASQPLWHWSWIILKDFVFTVSDFVAGHFFAFICFLMNTSLLDSFLVFSRVLSNRCVSIGQSTMETQGFCLLECFYWTICYGNTRLLSIRVLLLDNSLWQHKVSAY